MRTLLLFSALRVLVFAIPFGILLAIRLEWWAAALIAAVVGFCVSYIFLRPLRDKVAQQFVAARASKATSGDEAAEDAPPPSA